MAYPPAFKYTKDHEWIQIDGDRGKVGITDYAQQQLGDVVYVELPEKGAVLKAGQPFGTIESVKAVSELYAPISGEVVEREHRTEAEARRCEHRAARKLDDRDQGVETRASSRVCSMPLSTRTW
jgi:glycine cleavage system H protein